METMLTVEMQIAERARKHRSEALTNLHEFIDESLLQSSLNTLNKKGASGVDAETWIYYHKQRETRIPQLLTAFKSGNYRAPNIRRVYIPKGDGKLRPLGLPTVNHRGGIRVWTWEKIKKLMEEWTPLLEPKNLSQPTFSETINGGTVCRKAARTGL